MSDIVSYLLKQKGTNLMETASKDNGPNSRDSRGRFTKGPLRDSCPDRGVYHRPAHVDVNGIIFGTQL